LRGSILRVGSYTEQHYCYDDAHKKVAFVFTVFLLVSESVVTGDGSLPVTNHLTRLLYSLTFLPASKLVFLVQRKSLLHHTHFQGTEIPPRKRRVLGVAYHAYRNYVLAAG
jgi:hypothetical protein